MLGRSALMAVLVAVAAIFGGYYQFSLKERLKILGYGRVIVPVGNDQCTAYLDAKACEKIVIHQPTGLVYMACSTQSSRMHWLPTDNRLNATGKSSQDYVAVFNPSTEKVTVLKTIGYKFGRGLSVHGMDVVESRERPEDLLLYMVNHRAPFAPKRAEEEGQDSVIEVFRTRPGMEEIHYVATFKDPVISTPNDIVAGDEEMSFYFTNDHGFVRNGWARWLLLDTWFGLKWANVGYCHHSRGCKVAAPDLYATNGITKDKDGHIFVGSYKAGQIYVAEPQADNSLAITDIITTDRGIDNLSLDETGAIWATGLPKPWHMGNVHFSNPSNHTPSSALRITLNDGESRFFGEKYKVEKIFEDDGVVASGTTSVAYDSKRKKLYMHGVAAPYLTVCDIDLDKKKA